ARSNRTVSKTKSHRVGIVKLMRVPKLGLPTGCWVPTNTVTANAAAVPMNVVIDDTAPTDMAVMNCVSRGGERRSMILLAYVQRIRTSAITKTTATNAARGPSQDGSLVL